MNKKKSLDKKKDKIPYKKIIVAVLIFGIILTTVFSLLSKPTTAYAATCPLKGSESWKYAYVTGCASCGGSKAEYGDWPSDIYMEGDIYIGPNAGCGTITQTVDTFTDGDGNTYTDVTVTYRCYNCGYINPVDGKVYNRNNYQTWNNVISFEGTDENEDFAENNGPASRGSGAVPWYHCGFCDGLSAGSFTHQTCQSLTVKVSDAKGGTVSLSNGSTGEDRDTGATVNRYKVSGSSSGSEVTVILGPGATIDLTVAVNDGYEFTGWSNGAAGTTTTYTAPSSGCGSETVTANIGQSISSIEISFVSSGGVTLQNSITKEAKCGESFSYTAPSTITKNGRTYESPSYSCSNGTAGGGTTVTISKLEKSSYSITYVYTEKSYSISVNVSPQGSGSFTGDKGNDYYVGDDIQGETYANEGYLFAGWSGISGSLINGSVNSSTSGGSYSGTMPAQDLNITANYVTVTPTPTPTSTPTPTPLPTYTTTVIVHYTKDGAEVGKTENIFTYKHGDKYPGHTWGEVRTYDGKKYKFDYSTFSGCVTGEGLTANAAAITGNSTIDLWYAMPKYKVTVNVSGDATATTSGDGEYFADAPVTVSVSTLSQRTFNGWTNTYSSSLNPTGNPVPTSVNFTMPESDITWTADYGNIPRFTIDVIFHYMKNGTEVGREESSDSYDKGFQYAGRTYEQTKNYDGKTFTFSNSTFSGCVTGEGLTVNAGTIEENSTFEFWYSMPEYTVSVKAENDSEATVSGGGTYYEGDPVTISTSTNSQRPFNGWTNTYSSSLNSTNATVNFTMPASNISWTASYGAAPTATPTPMPNTYTTTVIVHYTKGGSEVGSTEDVFTYTHGDKYAGYTWGDTRYYGGKQYEFNRSTFSGCVTGSGLTANAATITGNSTIELWYSQKPSHKFINYYYTGSTLDGSDESGYDYHEYGSSFSYSVDSTWVYTFNGTRGYQCTNMTVSPSTAGVSVTSSGTKFIASGNITDDIILYRTFVMDGGEAPEITPIPTTAPDEPEVTPAASCTVVVSAGSGGSAYGGGTYSAGESGSISASAYSGYCFDYWYSGSSYCSISSSYSSSTSFTISENVPDGTTVYIYAYFDGPNTVAYYPNGGTGRTKYEYTSAYNDYTHTLADNPFGTPTGYLEFSHWNTKKDGSGTSHAAGETVDFSYKSTFSVYAQWIPITYIVQFAEDSINVTPTLSPQEIWIYDKPKAMPEALEERYRTVSYDLNKKDSMSTTPEFTAEVNDSNTKAVFKFLGWRPYHYTDGKYVQTGMDVVPPLTAQNLTTVQDDRIILFPEWGGESSYVTLPVVTCTGYKFHGWVFDKDETDTAKALASGTGDRKYQPKESGTLYAMLLPKTYTVALDYQNPDLNFTENIVMTFDAHGPDVAVPKRGHYTFQGYFTEPNGAGVRYYDKNGRSTRLWQIDDGSVTTLYAYWVLDTQIIYYRNGGMGYMGDTWLSNNATSVTLPKNLFSKAGYTFGKWTTNADGTGASYADEQTISNISVSSVISLYAQWMPESYTVTFNANGGSVSPISKSVQYENAYGSLPIPSKTGYTFSDWYTSDTNELIKADTIVTKTTDHELTAKWTANEYTVTFDWNFDYERTGIDTRTGWDGNTKTVVYASAYGSLPAPSKEGYTFLGWYTSESGGNGSGTVVTSSTTVDKAGAQTLYAKWINNEYLLNFDYNLDYRVDPNN